MIIPNDRLQKLRSSKYWALKSTKPCHDLDTLTTILNLWFLVSLRGRGWVSEHLYQLPVSNPLFWRTFHSISQNDWSCLDHSIESDVPFSVLQLLELITGENFSSVSHGENGAFSHRREGNCSTSAGAAKIETTSAFTAAQEVIRRQHLSVFAASVVSQCLYRCYDSRSQFSESSLSLRQQLPAVSTLLEQLGVNCMSEAPVDCD